MVEIIPAILTNDKEKLNELTDQTRGIVERVQIDIIDGIFSDNKTISPKDLEKVDVGNLRLDYHLMVKEPVDWIDSCASFKADRVIGQIEMMSNQKEFVDKVLSKGLVAGLALDLNTPVSNIDKEVLNELGVILLMSVPAGFGGQKFDNRALDKIVEVKKIKDERGSNFSICDDGGITLQLVDDAHFVGADEVSVGRRLFKGDMRKNIQELKESAHRLEIN